jgi:hypothetical protein
MKKQINSEEVVNALAKCLSIDLSKKSLIRLSVTVEENGQVNVCEEYTPCVEESLNYLKLKPHTEGDW